MASYRLPYLRKRKSSQTHFSGSSASLSSFSVWAQLLPATFNQPLRRPSYFLQLSLGFRSASAMDSPTLCRCAFATSTSLSIKELLAVSSSEDLALEAFCSDLSALRWSIQITTVRSTDITRKMWLITSQARYGYLPWSGDRLDWFASKFSSQRRNTHKLKWIWTTQKFFGTKSSGFYTSWISPASSWATLLCRTTRCSVSNTSLTTFSSQLSAPLPLLWAAFGSYGRLFWTRAVMVRCIACWSVLNWYAALYL